MTLYEEITAHHVVGEHLLQLQVYFVPDDFRYFLNDLYCLVLDAATCQKLLCFFFKLHEFWELKFLNIGHVVSVLLSKGMDNEL